MKSLVHSISFLVLVILTGCSGQANKGSVQEVTADSSNVRTVATDTFSSPDLSVHELKGHVKTCKTFFYDASIKDNEYIIKDTKVTSTLLAFSEQGYMIQDGIYDLTYDDQGKLIKGINTTDKSMKISVKRNKKGYITSLSSEDKKQGMESDQAYKITYQWNDKNEMVTETYQGWEWSSEYKYKYNDKGLLQESSNTENPDYETEIENTSTYIYTKFDDRGNWIERNIKIVSVTSTSDLGSDTPAKKEAPQVSYRVEKREITYF